MDTLAVSAVPLDGMALLVWFDDSTCRIYDATTFGIDDDAVHRSVSVLDDGRGLVWDDRSVLFVDQLVAHGTETDVTEGIIGGIIASVGQWRRGVGLNQVELSNASGVLQPSISRMEKGNLMPRIDTIVRALAPLGRTLVVAPLEDANVDGRWQREIK